MNCRDALLRTLLVCVLLLHPVQIFAGSVVGAAAVETSVVVLRDDDAYAAGEGRIDTLSASLSG